MALCPWTCRVKSRGLQIACSTPACRRQVYGASKYGLPLSTTTTCTISSFGRGTNREIRRDHVNEYQHIRRVVTQHPNSSRFSSTHSNTHSSVRPHRCGLVRPQCSTVRQQRQFHSCRSSLQQPNQPGFSQPPPSHHQQQQQYQNAFASIPQPNNAYGPHTTYFQPDPKPPSRPLRRILRAVLFSAAWFMAGAVFMAVQELRDEAGLLAGHGSDDDDNSILNPFEDMDPAKMQVFLAEQARIVLRHALIVGSIALDTSSVDAVLSTDSGYTLSEKAVGHATQLASNMPCEDCFTNSSFGSGQDPASEWAEWSIFDGHAGPRTAHELSNALQSVLVLELMQSKCFERPYVPNDTYVSDVIKRAFLEVDKMLLDGAANQIETGEDDRAVAVVQASAAYSGSCALMALFDAKHSVLRVANVGDSRAVLGRWNPQTRQYEAQLLSSDHNGFNHEEVARLQKEHPGEEVIDRSTGRIFGLAVTRAFGDARWKWPESVTRRAHEMFFGPAPRPNDVVKTPPYLTAEPEITETKIEASGKHADFVILASDGLWDHMTSEDAVTCVQMWLEKNRPMDFLKEGGDEESLNKSENALTNALFPDHSSMSSRTPIGDKNDFADTYWDRSEQCLNWLSKPKDFVVENEHCGEHLIKNALGGKRRGLLTSVISVQPPWARKVRDDITVQVIFFGDYHFPEMVEQRAVQLQAARSTFDK